MNEWFSPARRSRWYSNIALTLARMSALTLKTAVLRLGTLGSPFVTVS